LQSYKFTCIIYLYYFESESGEIMNKEWLFENYPFICKDNLTLAKIQPSQANAFIKLMNDETFVKYSPSRPEYNDYNITDLYRQIDALFKANQAVWLGVSFDEAVTSLDGIITLKKFDDKIDSCVLDFIFSNSFKTSNSAVKSLKAVLDFMFNKVEITRISAVCLPEHYLYKNLLEDAGFKLEGTSRQGDYWDGKGVVSVSYFSILKSDFLKDNQ
jgi:[ribosomal protein S5]-alanine N-acetyltransferase